MAGAPIDMVSAGLAWKAKQKAKAKAKKRELAEATTRAVEPKSSGAKSWYEKRKKAQKAEADAMDAARQRVKDEPVPNQVISEKALRSRRAADHKKGGHPERTAELAALKERADGN